MSLKISDNAISVASLGPEGKQIAFSPNNHRVFIANCNPTKDCATWTIAHCLESAHSQPISGISWHPTKNKIITCAHDRTAFVWDLDEDAKKWTPTVVMLDAIMTKGCTDCAFSASGDRILIASAFSAVAIGKYSKSLFWYTCKFCTPHTASVTTLAPHPSDDKILASGSTDSTLRLTCINTGKAEAGQPSFGQELQCFNVGAWVHAATFTPDAKNLIACLHSSQVMIFTSESGLSDWAPSFTVSSNNLPFTRVAVISDDAFIAAGFDCYPVKIQKASGSSWKTISEGKQPKAAAAELSGTEKARQMFQNEATLGQKSAVELPKTRHGNTVTGVLAAPGALKPYSFVTVAVDGRVECWKDSDLEPCKGYAMDDKYLFI